MLRSFTLLISIVTQWLMPSGENHLKHRYQYFLPISPIKREHLLSISINLSNGFSIRVYNILNIHMSNKYHGPGPTNSNTDFWDKHLCQMRNFQSRKP